MKKILFVLLTMTFIFLLGCSASPVESVGDSFMDALVNNDETALKSIVPEEFYEDIDNYISGTANIKDLDDYSFTYSGASVSVDGDYAIYTATTYLSYAGMNNEHTVSIYFKKQGEEWHIVNLE